MKFKVRKRFAFHILGKKDSTFIKETIPSGGIVDLVDINQYNQAWKLETLSDEEQLKLEAEEKRKLREALNPKKEEPKQTLSEEREQEKDQRKEDAISILKTGKKAKSSRKKPKAEPVTETETAQPDMVEPADEPDDQNQNQDS